MNARIRRLREQSINTPTTLSIERALIETAFYQAHYGTMPLPMLRARNFYEICQKKTIYIGDDELIVGERGPKPKAVPTFPELTCHSVADLKTLNERQLQPYRISQEDIDTYERVVIPYWKGKTQRERIFGHVSKEWEEAYHAGVFTEFMEQRAAGHTAMDGKMYRGLHLRPGSHRQATGTRGDGHLVRCGHSLCRAPCQIGREDGCYGG